MSQYDIFVPSVSRWTAYYTGQAEGTKRKLQALGIADDAPVVDMVGGALHSQKSLAVAGVGAAAAPSTDTSSSAAQIKMVAPTEQITEQAKSEVKREREEEREVIGGHVIAKHPQVPSQLKKPARAKKQPVGAKQTGRGVSKKAAAPSIRKKAGKKRAILSADDLDIFSR
jgi:hypothetical protein